MECLLEYWLFILLYIVFAVIHIYRGYDEDVVARRMTRRAKRKKLVAKVKDHLKK